MPWNNIASEYGDSRDQPLFEGGEIAADEGQTEIDQPADHQRFELQDPSADEGPDGVKDDVADKCVLPTDLCIDKKVDDKSEAQSHPKVPQCVFDDRSCSFLFSFLSAVQACKYPRQRHQEPH